MDISKRIGETLKTLFPDIQQITRNNLEQGHKEHSFYIKKRKSSGQNQFFNKQQRVYNYTLHYFAHKYPDDKMNQAETECEKMAERLLSDFHYLEGHYGKVINTDYDIQDNALLFHFRIRMRVNLPEAEPTYMETLEERSNLS